MYIHVCTLVQCIYMYVHVYFCVLPTQNILYIHVHVCMYYYAQVYERKHSTPRSCFYRLPECSEGTCTCTCTTIMYVYVCVCCTSWNPFLAMWFTAPLSESAPLILYSRTGRPYLLHECSHMYMYMYASWHMHFCRNY